MNRKEFVVIVLFVVSGFWYYLLVDDTSVEQMEVFVVEVTDGDTVKLENDVKVRFLGINTPEKNQPYYDEAKEFLEVIENETVFLEVIGTDRYGRLLAHVFWKGEHLNKEILEEGLATLYYYEKDVYYNSLKHAETTARENELGIWKRSEDHSCLELVKLQYEEDGGRCIDGEFLQIKNVCGFEIDFTFKDDATHIYGGVAGAGEVFEETFSCIWNDAGDSLYVYDSKGLLLFYRY